MIRLQQLARLLVAASMGCTLLMGCNSARNNASVAPADAAKHYQLRGKIMSIDNAAQSAVVSHDAVPGFMGAMTMSYRFKDPDVLTELHPGDRINATLTVAGEKYYLEDVVITAQSKPDYKPAGMEYHTPTAGDAAPDFVFRDQSGKKVSISTYRGKVVLVTFIYTRCPLSDYCPRMSRNFAVINQQLAADPPAYAYTHLLSVSFDPQYDTPSVLRSYGEAYTGKLTRETFDHWTFAAPLPTELPKVEQWFGVGVTPGENGTLSHSLSTCVFGKDGKLVSWYPTNDWTTAQIMHDVHKALAQAS